MLVLELHRVDLLVTIPLFKILSDLSLPKVSPTSGSGVVLNISVCWYRGNGDASGKIVVHMMISQCSDKKVHM